MIKKIKASRSEKIIFIFIILLATFSFGSFFLIKDKCLFVKDYDPKKIKFDKSKPEGDFDRMADNSKAKKFLNWVPSISLDKGLKKIYDWCERKLS